MGSSTLNAARATPSAARTSARVVSVRAGSRSVTAAERPRTATSGGLAREACASAATSGLRAGLRSSAAVVRARTTSARREGSRRLARRARKTGGAPARFARMRGAQASHATAAGRMGTWSAVPARPAAAGSVMWIATARAWRTAGSAVRTGTAAGSRAVVADAKREPSRVPLARRQLAAHASRSRPLLPGVSSFAADTRRHLYLGKQPRFNGVTPNPGPNGWSSTLVARSRILERLRDALHVRAELALLFRLLAGVVLREHERVMEDRYGTS